MGGLKAKAAHTRECTVMPALGGQHGCTTRGNYLCTQQPEPLAVSHRTSLLASLLPACSGCTGWLSTSLQRAMSARGRRWAEQGTPPAAPGDGQSRAELNQGQRKAGMPAGSYLSPRAAQPVGIASCGPLRWRVSVPLVHSGLACWQVYGFGQCAGCWLPSAPTQHASSLLSVSQLEPACFNSHQRSRLWLACAPSCPHSLLAPVTLPRACR